MLHAISNNNVFNICWVMERHSKWQGVEWLILLEDLHHLLTSFSYLNLHRTVHHIKILKIGLFAVIEIKVMVITQCWWHLEFYRPQFFPNPQDGSLYRYTLGRGRDPLKKLPFTIPQLVANSPCRSSDGIFYLGVWQMSFICYFVGLPTQNIFGMKAWL